MPASERCPGQHKGTVYFVGRPSKIAPMYFFMGYQPVGPIMLPVGMTSRFEERAAEQLLERQIEIGKIPGLNNLSQADARAVEQTLIDAFKLGKDGGSLINKINSISKTRDSEYYINSILRGLELLKQTGYSGF